MLRQVDIFVKANGFGISIQAINISLFGNEEEYIDPITTSSLLEFWHSEIFFTMMILLTLSTIFVRLSHSDIIRSIILNILMLNAIISLIALPLAYFYHNFFVYLFLYPFLIWHIAAIYASLYSLFKLYND